MTANLTKGGKAMKMNRIFAALCAIVAIGVSCQKEMTVKNGTEEIIVPEGMKYVSFEIGTPTKINGNPVKWNSSAESVAVLAINNDTCAIYEFNTTGPGSVLATTTISGLVDEGADLKFVAFPYGDKSYPSPRIDLEKDPSGNTLLFPQRLPFGFANPGVASATPYACKIQCNDGVYSAKTNLQPLCSFLKVTLPARANDHILGSKDDATSLADSLYITGVGVAGRTYVDFSTDEAVTSLASTAELKTIKVAFKIDKTSGLPKAGEYLIPIIPGEIPSLDVKVTYTPGSDSKEYSDYSENYGVNTFKQGAYKSLTICAPYVSSANTISASVEGTTLSMTGSAVFYTGGKVTASNYNFGFEYREKGTETWTSKAAVFADNKFTASLTIDPGKTYEVKAFAAAPGAIKPATDQVVYGDVKESGAYVPPVTYVIDTFGLNEYDGINEAYCWKCKDNTFPSKTDGKAKTPFTFDYYKKGTDTTPYFSGIILYSNSSTNNISFNKDRVLLYSGYVKFPGITGKRVTNVTFSIISSTSAGNMTVSSFDGTTSYGTAAYTSKTNMDLSVDLNGIANDGVKVNVQTWNIGKMEITYSSL